MKKSITLFATAMLCGAAFAAANDALISFSTKGPDKYADGTAVLDGECYALVWTPTASAGAVVAADGSVQGGEIVLTAPVAKNGRCPKVVFEVDAGLVSSRYKDGSWSVYLLDTRRYGEGGAVSLAGLSGGHATVVNASGLVSGSTVRFADSNGQMAGIASLSGVSAASETAVPEGTPRPEIVGIRVEGANVFVTVKGTVPYLQYDLATGDAPTDVSEKANVPHCGAESVDEEVTFVTPVKPGPTFFKVNRK
ncbi:MAG: hypothetical protein IKF72_05055 [Kiritimatiellae bacterium]|nr:hypothetical protein [Kiritimatiellia bacterium]